MEVMINHFHNDHDVPVHLASGTTATSAVMNDMGIVLEKRESAALEFMKTHIIGEELNIYL